MTETEWTFYDFDKNWTTFYKIWQTDEIQEILKKDMDNWCIYEAFYKHQSDGTMVKPIWSKGEPLWHLSRTDYHATKIWNISNKRIENERMITNYEKRMIEICPSKYTKMSKDEINIEFYDICSEKINDECSPKPHTLESLILVMGKNYISDALFACAEKLFPNNDIIYYHGNGNIDKTDNDQIYIYDHKIVFDLLDFYYVTRDNSKIYPKYI